MGFRLLGMEVGWRERDWRQEDPQGGWSRRGTGAWTVGTEMEWRDNGFKGPKATFLGSD